MKRLSNTAATTALFTAVVSPMAIYLTARTWMAAYFLASFFVIIYIVAYLEENNK